MIKILRRDNPDTAEKIETKSFYRWQEEHKQFIDKLANGTTELVYQALVLHYIMASAPAWEMARSGDESGTIKVNSQGYIRYITNESGHFQPTVSEALNYPQIFRDSGLIVDNAWIKVSEFFTSMSNYITDTKVFYNDPIQYMP